MKRICCMLVCALLLPSCRPASAGDDYDADALARLEAEPVLRIGSVDDPDYGFSRPAAADVDRDGNLYVLEALDSQIRVYDPRGRLLHRIGGPGSGPGEFEGAPRFGVLGDTVWAYDMFARRISLFDRAGALLVDGRADEVAIEVPAGFGYISPWAMRPDGLFSSHFGRIAYRRDSPPTEAERADSLPVARVLFAPTGQVLDTIGWDPSPPPNMVAPPGAPVRRFERITVGQRRYLVPEPPAPLPDWLPLHDGRIVVEYPPAVSGDGGAFTVTRIGLAGDTVWQRRFQYRPTAYSAVDLDSIAARAARGVTPQMARAGAGGTDPDPAAQPALRAAMQFPEFRLPVRYAWLDQDERVWIRRDAAEGEPARWILLDEEGRPRGELELPAGSRVLWSRGDEFWLMEPDEYDVPWLVRYRMRIP